MKVAVTGSSGQLGSLILRRLIDDRSVKEIRALDLAPPGLVSGKLRSLSVDLRDPGPALEAHLAGCDALVHAAFVATRRAPPAELRAINVQGSARVFAAALAGGARQLLHLSSAAAYGPAAAGLALVTEETPLGPPDDFAYGQCKVEVEAALAELAGRHPDVAVTVLRPGFCLGRRMAHPGAQLWRQRLLLDLSTPVGAAPGGAGGPPLVWDEDVADAVLLALKKRVAGTFNLVACSTLPTAALAREAGFRYLAVPLTLARGAAALTRVSARLGLGAPVDPAWARSALIPLTVSSARALAELGWKPRCPTDLEVLRRFQSEVPTRVDARIAAFMTLAALGARHAPRQAALEGMELQVHLDLTGPGGGDYTVRVSDGRARVSRGAPRPPGSVLTLPAALFRQLLAGQADVSRAQLTGKVRIEGEPSGMLVLAGLVSTFRAGAGRPGLPGRLVQGFSRWLGGGPADAPRGAR